MPDTDLNTQRIVPMELQENVQAMDIDYRLLGVSNGGEGSSKGIVNGTQEGQTQFDAHFPSLTGKKGTGKEKVQGTQLPDKQKQKHTAWKGENKKVFMNTGVGARLRYIKDQPVVLKNSDALPIDQVYTNAPDLLGIIDADEAQLLDILPPSIDLILRSKEVENGEEVVNSVFDQILATNWSKVLLVKMVSIVREFPVLDKNRRSEFLEKVFDGMKIADLQDIPSLSYQLLVAASKGFNKREVMEGIVVFFGSKMGVKATSTARQVEGTVLLHMNFAVKQDPSLVQELLGLLKSNIRVLNHFIVAVLLSLSRISKFSVSCMGVLKTAVLSVYRDNEVASICKWLPGELKKGYSQRAILVEKVFMRSVNESNYGREHIVPSFVHFGFLLLESVHETNFERPDDPDKLMGVEGLSIQILKNLFEAHEMSRTEIIEQCKFRILSLKPKECKPVASMQIAWSFGIKLSVSNVGTCPALEGTLGLLCIYGQ